MRADSGWNTAEPKPTVAAASRMIANWLATLSMSKPANVKHMPIASDHGCALRSVTMPTTGCSSEVVNWNASVIRPIWVKSSA
jgi:hypothetical protein